MLTRDEVFCRESCECECLRQYPGTHIVQPESLCEHADNRHGACCAECCPLLDDWWLACQ